MRILLVIDQGKFHKVDNNLKFTNTLELLIFILVSDINFFELCVRIPQLWKIPYIPTLPAQLDNFVYF